jgi:hypothetical protein
VRSVGVFGQAAMTKFALAEDLFKVSEGAFNPGIDFLASSFFLFKGAWR